MTLTLWHCSWCGKHYPIQPMARDCEAKHRALTEETA